MPIVVRGVMKPIPTLYKPLASVDIDTKEAFKRVLKDHDSCAVPAAGVVAESVVAHALVEQFGKDGMELIQQTLRNIINTQKF